MKIPDYDRTLIKEQFDSLIETENFTVFVDIKGISISLYNTKIVKLHDQRYGGHAIVNGVDSSHITFIFDQITFINFTGYIMKIEDK